MKTKNPNFLDALPTVLYADDVVGELAVRGAKGTLSTEERDALLAKCSTGEYVELFIDILAFEQTPKPNRNAIRFADDALDELAASGVNTVFLADHNQRTAAQRGGTIVASTLERKGTKAQLRQTVKLTHPAFVANALRGLVDRFSIGWEGKGPVLCSICNTSFYKCAHWPGETYDKKVCEVVFTKAGLLETSTVNVPAVPQAQIEGIRAALALDRGPLPQSKGTRMNDELIALLGLAATASDTEITEAVKKLQAKSETLAARNATLEGDVKRATEQLAAHAATEAQRTEDAFFAEALAQGKLAANSPEIESLRKLYRLDANEVRAMLAARAPITPVGQPLQSAGKTVEASADDSDAAIVKALAARAKLEPQAYVALLDKLGVKTSEDLRRHAERVLQH